VSAGSPSQSARVSLGVGGKSESISASISASAVSRSQSVRSDINLIGITGSEFSLTSPKCYFFFHRSEPNRRREHSGAADLNHWATVTYLRRILQAISSK
jgi:hypothetical protein